MANIACKKQDIEHMKAYIKKHMYNYGFEKKVEVIEDFEKFKKVIDSSIVETRENIKDITNKLMILQI